MQGSMMGRYLYGTQGFEYKYAVAKQSSNLGILSNYTDIGTSLVEPSFLIVTYDSEESAYANCIDLAKEIIAETGATGEITRFANYQIPCVSGGENSLEFIQYAMAENIVEVLTRLDQRSQDPIALLALVGKASFSLKIEEWAEALKWLNRYVQPELTIESLTTLEVSDNHQSMYQTIYRQLADKEDFYPWMMFCFLHHAVYNQLPQMTVFEQSHEIEADSFWELTLEWGPPIFQTGSVTTADQLFAVALVRHFLRQKRTSNDAWKGLEQLGDPRFERYRMVLGG
jgi:hypothetical protein